MASFKKHYYLQREHFPVDVFQAMSTTSGYYHYVVYWKDKNLEHKPQAARKDFQLFFWLQSHYRADKAWNPLIGIRGTVNVVKFISKNLQQKILCTPKCSWNQDIIWVDWGGWCRNGESVWHCNVLLEDFKTRITYRDIKLLLVPTWNEMSSHTWIKEKCCEVNISRWIIYKCFVSSIDNCCNFSRKRLSNKCFFFILWKQIFKCCNDGNPEDINIGCICLQRFQGPQWACKRIYNINIFAWVPAESVTYMKPEKHS